MPSVALAEHRPGAVAAPRLAYGKIPSVASKVIGLAGRRTGAAERETLAALTDIAARMRPAQVALEPSDIAQEAYLRIRTRMEEGVEVGRSYLWRAAYTAMIDMLRRERAEQRRRTQLPVADVAPGPSPEASAQGNEIGTAIHGCVGELPDDRAQVVVLYLQGHAAKDVRALLGWPSKKIDNLLYRGLRRLRACLEKKGFTP
ncbi:MAG: RNA polymerase sigma factor [Myxococcota bacterium]